ncbi:MAG: hypothetical protein LC789_06310 [Actinobacteria bacterium]|nr:hypothetical protein [Actinomycetota bacterium]MCA1722236.1 hypothetical protein [Actinomycetota bacterium]
MSHQVQAQTRTSLARTGIAIAGGAAAYYVALTAFAVSQGRSATYPLRAVVAIFRGNHALPAYGPTFDVTTGTAIFAGSGWILLLSAACAGTFALLVRRRVLPAPLLVVAAVAWSLLWLGFTLLVFDNGGPVGVRRAVSSFQGLHELGSGAFVVAHVAFGASVGSCFAWPQTRRRPTAPVDERLRRGRKALATGPQERTNGSVAQS